MSLSWHFYNCLLDRQNLVSEFENSLLTRSYRSSFLSTHFNSSPLVKINAIRSVLRLLVHPSIKRTASSSKFEMRLALAKFLFNLFALAVTGITFWIMRCFSFSCISEGNILAKIMTYNLNSFISRPLKLYGQLCFSLSAKSDNNLHLLSISSKIGHSSLSNNLRSSCCWPRTLFAVLRFFVTTSWERQPIEIVNLN